MLTINGISFGTTGAVARVNGVNCPIISQDHSIITCTIPGGQGTNQQIDLTCYGQTTAPAFLSYQPPIIYDIQPGNGPTTGGTTCTLNG